MPAPICSRPRRSPFRSIRRSRASRSTTPRSSSTPSRRWRGASSRTGRCCAAARALLSEALKIDADPVAQGQVNYRLGYCEWKLGNAKEAERLLRVAREQLRTQHPLDADAAQLLARILQDHEQFREALSFD